MEITIQSLEYIDEAARQFVQQIGTNDIIAFYGKMGAGKTTFIKALCQQMGVTDTVTSPTFAIVNEYLDGNQNPIYHFDFYRIRRSEEVLDIGFEDYINSGSLCLIEWPEMIEDYLPDDTLRIYIDEQPDGSRIITEKK